MRKVEDLNREERRIQTGKESGSSWISLSKEEIIVERSSFINDKAPRMKG